VIHDFYPFRQIYREYHIGCSPKLTPNFTPIFCDTAGFRMIFLFLGHLSKRLKIKELKPCDMLIYNELASLSLRDSPSDASLRGFVFGLSLEEKQAQSTDT